MPARAVIPVRAATLRPRVRGTNPARPSASRLTRRGWAMLAAAVVCTIVAYESGLSELLYAAGFLAVLPVAALLLVRLRRRRFSVVRSFAPAVISAGSVATVDLAVRNLSATASGSASWSDRIPWAPGVAGPGTLPGLAPSVPGAANRRARTVVRYTLRPPSRGIYDIGPLAVSYSDPFALASGSASLGGVQQLSVIPSIVPLGGGGPSILAGEGSARIVQRRTAGNDDDLMTREYRSGDALRRVHWRASARHGELMVRQEEQRTYPEARLLVDTFSSGYAPDDDAAGSARGGGSGSPSFEWAIRMVASLGVHLHRAGYLVEVVETAPPQIAPLGNVDQGVGQNQEFLVSLAGIRPIGDSWRGREADPSVPAREQKAVGAPGPVFAILAEPDARTLGWILAQRRPFEVGVAFVIRAGNAGITGNGMRADSAADAFGALTEAGWTCIEVRDTDDPALAWSSLPGSTGLPGSTTQSGTTGQSRGDER